MNERKIRPVLWAVGILVWCMLMGHSYLSLWEVNTPDYRISENQGELMMYIKGEVENPGPYSFKNGDTYEELIALAGGVTDSADLTTVDCSTLCVDGETLYIEKAKTLKASSTKKKAAKPTAVPVSFPLNINEATHYELCALPGIGETLAERILDYRNSNGAFASVEDLLNVSGIGEKKFDAIRDKIYVK